MIYIVAEPPGELGGAKLPLGTFELPLETLELLLDRNPSSATRFILFQKSEMSIFIMKERWNYVDITSFFYNLTQQL